MENVVNTKTTIYNKATTFRLLLLRTFLLEMSGFCASGEDTNLHEQ